MHVKLQYVERRVDCSGAERWYWHRRGHKLANPFDNLIERTGMAEPLNAAADNAPRPAPARASLFGRLQKRVPIDRPGTGAAAPGGLGFRGSARCGGSRYRGSPIAGPNAPSDEPGDPGAFRDLLSLELRRFAGGEPDWKETAVEMRQVIAGLASRGDTAGNGRFQLDNRAVLDQMRDSDRDA